MPGTPSTPSLPHAILPQGAEDTPGLRAQPYRIIDPPTTYRERYRIPIPRFRLLKEGCYFLQWHPWTTPRHHFNGTLRVERNGAGVTASGDLYHHPEFTIGGWPSFGFRVNPDPTPSAGIPIFPRTSYRYYLRVTGILEWLTTESSFTLAFERHRFDPVSNGWTNEGEFTAQMVFRSIPPGYPSNGMYLDGALRDSAGADLGRISMGWVSPYLRKATLEIDRVSDSEFPGDNGDGVDWADVYDAVGWEMDVQESDDDVDEPSGASWSEAEAHAAMLDRRDSADLDREWRYHIVCVRRIDTTDRGVMYDAFGGDSNNIPREGAVLASHWTIPDTPTWGDVAGERFGAAAAPYFRTAVHEIGHAMGLYHNFVDTGYMNTTGTIAASAGTFPGNVLWAFNDADQRRLRHMPDPWVRPGMIPFGDPYENAPISPEDRLDLGGAMTLVVEPLLESVPIGAPVRVRVTLTNRSETPMDAPESLSLKTEHVTGTVVGPSGTRRGFRSLVRCIEEHEMRILKPGESLSHDLTLLRGADGALFPAPGVHRVGVNVRWTLEGMPVRVDASAPVMITPPEGRNHAAAALKALSSPDLLITLALGGDHMVEGVDALEAVMEDSTLAPHFGAVQAKRVGRRFRNRDADPAKALEIIGDETVMTPSEVASLAKIAEELPAAERKKKDRASGLKAMKKKIDGRTSLGHRVDELL